MRLLKSLTLLAALFFTVVSQAALPPLSDEEREASSSIIVIGKVVKIKKTIRKNAPEYQDNVYTVTMAVDCVIKGLQVKSITFTFWKAAKRPAGWCGPSGQNGSFKKHDHIRAFLQVGEDGNKSLIEPNGFDKL